MAKRIKNLRHPITAVVNGHPCELLTVGHLARAVGRTPWTVKHWQRIGLLPRPQVILNPKVPQARRGLYKSDFVAEMKVIGKKDYLYPRLDRADWQKFHSDVMRAYEKTIAPFLSDAVIDEVPTKTDEGE